MPADPQPNRYVLVVEDDEDIRDALVDMLAHHAYKPSAAKNGQDALDQLRASEKKPSVILLDLMMPVMDGWQFRAAQRAQPTLQDIPVIVVSANIDAFESSRLGAAAFLKKPVGVRQLLDAVSAARAG
jgi:CheY-like chemotaxis protein